MYFLKRLILIVPTLCLVSVLLFVLLQLLPGGPIESLLARRSSVDGAYRSSILSRDQQAALDRYYGFDQSAGTRYRQWIGNVVRLDLGQSYYYNEPVIDVLWRAFPVSFCLSALTIFLTLLASLPLGVIMAITYRKMQNLALEWVLLVAYVLPGFAIGIVLILFFSDGIFKNLFPLQGATGEHFSKLSFAGKTGDLLWHLTLPAVALTAGFLAPLALLVRNTIREQLLEDYVRAARARGASEYRVIFIHVSKRTLLPVCTFVGQRIGQLMGGLLVIETLFGLHGLGRLGFESILRRDYGVVMAIVLLFTLFQIVGNLISDFCYQALDPRVRFS